MKKNKKERMKAQGAEVSEVATAEASTGKVKKVKKAKEGELDEKNLGNTKAKITKEKDLMYVYPKDASTLEARKTFRSGVRRKLESFKKSIAKAKKEEKADLVATATEWAKGIYAAGHLPTF